MANKWRRATDAAMAFRVFLKRQASEELGKEHCDIMRNTVLPLAKEAGWLEDISAEGLKLTKKEEEIANNSYVNSERADSRLRHSQSQALYDCSAEQGRRAMLLKSAEEGDKLKATHRMTMDEEPKVTETHGVKHLNAFQRGIWKAIKNNPQWKTAVQQREFGIRGAIHYLRCAKSTNSQVKALLKYKKKGR